MTPADHRPVAALYDIHGNLPALDAALAAADAAGAGRIVCGGDVVLGPMPVETLERLLTLGDRVRFVRGNCDRLVVDAFDGRPPAALPPSVQETVAWTARQLDRRHRAALAAFAETLALHVPGFGPVRFCHATPRSDDEIVTADTPDDRVAATLAGVAEPTVVCGHTHMAFDRTVGSTRLVNAGSVGMPFDEPGAHWLLLGPGVRHVRTPYDLGAAADAVRASDYPDAAGFAERHLLSAPLPLSTAREIPRA